jgi:hypothetical protein
MADVGIPIPTTSPNTLQYPVRVARFVPGKTAPFPNHSHIEMYCVWDRYAADGAHATTYATGVSALFLTVEEAQEWANDWNRKVGSHPYLRKL